MSKGQLIANELENIVMELISQGLSFEEGLVFFKAGVLLMNAVNKNPDIDENFLAKECEKYVRQELSIAGIIN